MKKWFALTGLLALAAGVAAAEPPTCEQIREQVKAHTGVPVRPNIDLLRTAASRQDCKFSSAEVYRAAYGETPIPKNTDRVQRRKHRKWHDDDDD
jgi:hypothetical protein